MEKIKERKKLGLVGRGGEKVEVKLRKEKKENNKLGWKEQKEFRRWKRDR